MTYWARMMSCCPSMQTCVVSCFVPFLMTTIQLELLRVFFFSFFFCFAFAEKCIIRKVKPAFQPNNLNTQHRDAPAKPSNRKQLPKSRDEKSLKHRDIGQDVAQSHVSDEAPSLHCNIHAPQAIGTCSSILRQLCLAVMCVLTNIAVR